MPTKFLTREDIIETTGAERPEELEDLEVLFLTFDEISGLQCCPNLRRLTLIDNGLRRISNLTPVSMSLQILCLCDQSIEAMENFTLPNLRELYLHRNQIRRIDGLEGCPRLKKLWLFQNQIVDIAGLEAVPDLEELWLQANDIVSLTGIEMNPNLANLGLAGNRIHDLREVRRLTSLPRLKEVSFTDIHFGRCPIADEEGYRQYIVLQLRQVRVLDGVKLKPDAIAEAEDVYFREMTAFHESLQTIEEVYQKNLRAIEMQHQSRESYSQVLEKEMTVALKELQGLVDEGRKIVKKEIEHCEHLVESNLTALQTALQTTEKKTEQALTQHTQQLADEYGYVMNLVHLLELVESNHLKIMHLLADIQQHQPPQQQPSLSSPSLSKTQQQQQQQQPTSTAFAYQYLGNNAADFVLMATLLDTSRVLYQQTTTAAAAGAAGALAHGAAGGGDLQVTEAESTKNTPRHRRASSASATKSASIANAAHAASSSVAANGAVGPGSGETPIVTKPLELARLYRVVRLSSTASQDTAVPPSYASYKRLFTIVPVDVLYAVLRYGWASAASTGNGGTGHGSGSKATSSSATQSLLFSDDAELLALLYEQHEAVTPLQLAVSDDMRALQARADEDLRGLLTLKQPSSATADASRGKEDAGSRSRHPPLGKAVVLLSVHAACVAGEEDTAHGGLSMMSSAPATASIAIPQAATQRRMLLEDILSGTKARVLTIRNRPTPTPTLPPPSSSSSSSGPRGDGSNGGSKLYAVPTSSLASLPSTALIAEFIALAINHTSTGDEAASTASAAAATVASKQRHAAPTTTHALLKNLEGRLELLLLPTHHLEDASRLLSSYEDESRSLLKRYVDQLLEGVDASQAAILRQAEEDLVSQEASLKAIREDIEQERRGQEVALRELKAQQQAFEGSAAGSGSGSGSGSGAGGGGGGMQHSGSSKQIRSRR